MIIHAAELDPEGVAVDFPLAQSSLVTDPDEPILVHSGALRGRVAPRRGGLSFRGQLSGRVEVPCARCLTPYSLSMDRELDLFFAFAPVRGKEVQIPDDALDYGFVNDGDAIDLEQIATEQIYLEIPMKPLCGAACRGLCPRCGVNLNLGPCCCESAGSLP